MQEYVIQYYYKKITLIGPATTQAFWRLEYQRLAPWFKTTLDPIKNCTK